MEANTLNQHAPFQTFLPLTKHAQQRMFSRRFSYETVMAVLTYGRLTRTRGAEIYAIGKKEVEFYSLDNIDLRNLEGVQVVCSTDGAVLTIYRNKNFRSLHPRGSRHAFQIAA